MRNLTNRELKCIEKFCQKYHFYLNPNTMTNGNILEMIRYAKRLKLKKDKKWTYKIAKEMLDKIEHVEEKNHSIFFKWIKWITTKEVKRPFIEKGI